MKQTIIEGAGAYVHLGEVLSALGTKKYMLVYTGSAKKQPVWKYLEELGTECVLFSDLTPNPKYEEVVKGVELFRQTGCDTVIAVGGGSAIDVAKCIKLYAKMPKGSFFLENEYVDTKIPLIAIPTTAGTGSESTPFSVIYYGGVKQSVHHSSIMPDYAILDPDTLESLPQFQKKCTVLDAFCQAIESWWSVYSTEESRAYAKEAVELIAANIYEYVDDNTDASRHRIMIGSNLAGRAIAITSTTAPHAMCYKLTTGYSLPHGYAVALCLPRVWSFMQSRCDKCTDKRGYEYLTGVFADIARSMGYDSAADAVCGFDEMLLRFGITPPDESDVEGASRTLADAVNVERLGNNPVSLDNGDLRNIYMEILTK